MGLEKQGSLHVYQEPPTNREGTDIGHASLYNTFGVQWQRYWKNAPYPDLVKGVPHVAFEVDDIDAALKDQKVIIKPNSPSEGLTVAFIEVNGAPIELMQYDRHSADKESALSTSPSLG